MLNQLSHPGAPSFVYLSPSPGLSTIGTALYSAPYFSIPSTMYDISQTLKKRMVFDVPIYLVLLSIRIWDFFKYLEFILKMSEGIEAVMNVGRMNC